MAVVMLGRDGAQRATTLAALLPEAFTFADVRRGQGG
jgi:hypothetical protein